MNEEKKPFFFSWCLTVVNIKLYSTVKKWSFTRESKFTKYDSVCHLSKSDIIEIRIKVNLCKCPKEDWRNSLSYERVKNIHTESLTWLNRFLFNHVCSANQRRSWCGLKARYKVQTECDIINLIYRFIFLLESFNLFQEISPHYLITS